MTALADQNSFPQKAGRGMMTDWLSIVNVGASGAPTPDTNKSDPGFTWARASAGVYNITFPPCPRGVIKPLIVKTATPTVFTAHVTAFSDTAGTATIRYNNAAGAATDPANGDIIGCVLKGAQYSQ